MDTRVISSVDGAQVFTSSAKGAAYEKVSTCALRPGGNGIASRAEARRLQHGQRASGLQCGPNRYVQRSRGGGGGFPALAHLQ